MEYVDGKYVITNPISDENIAEMRLNMSEEDLDEFDEFLNRNWGIKPQSLEYTEETEVKPRRGRRPKTITE